MQTGCGSHACRTWQGLNIRDPDGPHQMLHAQKSKDGPAPPYEFTQCLQHEATHKSIPGAALQCNAYSTAHTARGPPTWLAAYNVGPPQWAPPLPALHRSRPAHPSTCASPGNFGRDWTRSACPGDQMPDTCRAGGRHAGGWVMGGQAWWVEGSARALKVFLRTRTGCCWQLRCLLQRYSAALGRLDVLGAAHFALARQAQLPHASDPCCPPGNQPASGEQQACHELAQPRPSQQAPTPAHLA